MLLMESTAGTDQMPLKSLPPRQLIGPRPPPPPTPKPNFLTLGRTTTQYARVNKSGGTLLLSSIALNTVEAFLSVSSSFDLSAPQAGTIRTTRNIGINNRFQDAFLPLNRGRSDLTSMMGFPLDFRLRLVGHILRNDASVKVRRYQFRVGRSNQPELDARWPWFNIGSE